MSFFKRIRRKKSPPYTPYYESQKREESRPVRKPDNKSADCTHCLTTEPCTGKDICPICQIYLIHHSSTSKVQTDEASYSNILSAISDSPLNEKKSSERSVEQLEKLKHMKETLKKDLPTFMRLSKKIQNIKTFYPNIYGMSDNIIEVWGRDEKALNMKKELLNYDKEDTQCIWI
ncbi:uncharacterized protein LOC109601346 [Aethina tumida]|uniref:uncharacterized protein LOC109601346 n=1 Tax=Aethina tumida TaxID=116153 RepID=UPI00096AE0A6|nr:uncharacterized protein LOC109601346 [Aethina tumida]